MYLEKPERIQFGTVGVLYNRFKQNKYYLNTCFLFQRNITYIDAANQTSALLSLVF